MKNENNYQVVIFVRVIVLMMLCSLCILMLFYPPAWIGGFKLIAYVFLGGLLGICLLLAWRLAYFVAKPLTLMSEMLNEVAAGNLSFEKEKKAALGILALSFNDMGNRLRDVISQIYGLTQTVFSSTERLNSASRGVSDNAGQIAATMEELSAGSQEIAYSVENAVAKLKTTIQILDNVRLNVSNTSNRSGRISELIDDGQTAVSTQNQSMQETAQAVQLMGQAMENLQEKSSQIGSIVETISSIADQTNLLALNAAIEAARAGDSGRGFAVVADEVRKLAENSAQATGKINQLITEVQKEMAVAVQEVQRTSSVVRKQENAITNSEQVFKDIAEQALTVAEDVDKTKELVEELEGNAKIVGQMLESVAGVTEEAAASAQEVSASTQEQTNSLVQVMHSTNRLKTVIERLYSTLDGFQMPKVAYNPWASEIASAFVFKHIYQEAVGEDLSLIRVEGEDGEEMYQAIAARKVDGAMSYWEGSEDNLVGRYQGKLTDLAANIEDARFGLAVPPYVEIDSIEQLEQYRQPFAGKIIGIESTSVVVKLTNKAIKHYDLDYQLTEGTEEDMLTALEKAIVKKEWIVVTGWQPHWKFPKWNLKFLKDPKGIYGKDVKVKTIVWSGLEQHNLKLHKMFKHFKWTSEQSGEMIMYLEEGLSPDAAAQKFLQNHPEFITKACQALT